MVVTKQAARRCHWREALGMNDKLDRSNRTDSPDSSQFECEA